MPRDWTGEVDHEYAEYLARFDPRQAGIVVIKGNVLAMIRGDTTISYEFQVQPSASNRGDYVELVFSGSETDQAAVCCLRDGLLEIMVYSPSSVVYDPETRTATRSLTFLWNAAFKQID